MDYLRDRIAKAIYLEANNWGGPNWETISPKVKPAYMAQADAVIRELGIDDPLSAHRLRMCADTMDAYWASVGEEYDSDTLREEAELA